MRIAVVGSRGIEAVDLDKYVRDCDEIVSGGAVGVDSCAAEYAKRTDVRLTEFLPEYNRFGRGAPLKRNLQIIEYSDEVIAFWDGSSNGTKYVIDQCKRLGKKVTVHIIKSARDFYKA